MNDKEWLNRVLIAYQVYKEKNTDSESIKNFLLWLYQQYGIIVPDKLKD